MKNVLARRIDPSAPLPDGQQLQLDASAMLMAADQQVRRLTPTAPRAQSRFARRVRRNPRGLQVKTPTLAPQAPERLAGATRIFKRSATHRAGGLDPALLLLTAASDKRRGPAAPRPDILQILRNRAQVVTMINTLRERFRQNALDLLPDQRGDTQRMALAQARFRYVPVPALTAM